MWSGTALGHQHFVTTIHSRHIMAACVLVCVNYDDATLLNYDNHRVILTDPNV